jgi:aromatic-L-amino-acid/L-tryptophan decarboxylase
VRETGRLGDLTSFVLPALDAFLAGAHAPVEHLDEPRGAWRAQLAGDLPERGSSPEEVLRLLADVVVPHGSPMADPGFLGFITAVGATVPTVASLVQSVVANQRYFDSSGGLLERVALRWTGELLGLPDHVDGVISSDGSAATVVALGAARQHAFEQRGVDVAASGVPDGTRPVVYASAEAHHCVLKAAGVLGLGRDAVRLVPVDERCRMRADALAELLAADVADGRLPVAVVATTGTTATGSVDPVGAVADLCRQHGVFLHVDGAYGAFGVLDPRAAPLFSGWEGADCVLVDAHKWLGTPIGAGMLLARDPGLLERAFTAEPSAYLQDAELEDRSFFGDLGTRFDERGLELSAPARGVMVWAALAELGREGTAAVVARDLDRARQLADLVRAHDELELLVEPDLSVVCLRYRGEVPAERLDVLNARLLERLRRETPWMPSPARPHGRFAVRPVFLNARTDDDAPRGLADAVLRLGREIAARA